MHARSRNNKTSDRPMTYLAMCPSCHCEGFFHNIGTQHWPEATARAMGVDNSVALYECTHCRTSVTEYSLNPAIAPAKAKKTPSGSS